MSDRERSGSEPIAKGEYGYYLPERAGLNHGETELHSDLNHRGTVTQSYTVI